MTHLFQTKGWLSDAMVIPTPIPMKVNPVIWRLNP